LINCDTCIQNGSKEFSNKKYWTLFSGGKDSSCVAYRLTELGKFEGVVTFDTGISIPGYIEWIKETCKKRKWKLHIEKGGFITGNEKVQCYEDFVKEYGFPRPRSHTWIMATLKERAFVKFKTKHSSVDPTNKRKRIRPFIASGVRKKESKQRMKNVKGEYGVFGGCKIWNPIYEWTNEQVWKYVRKYNIEISPAYETLHISGDCLCGAYAHTKEMNAISIFYPEVAERLEKLELEIKDDKRIKCKTWGVDNFSSFSIKYMKLDSILCGECDINTNE
jgi:3'-phosphoadenosine 5'-phosphosulfate sulfotransferase (PAPS reductase)/FAD synthetase